MNPASSLPHARRMFRLTYANVEKDEPPKLHRCRDGIAFDELGAALSTHGFSYATTLYFYPHARSAFTDFPRLNPADLIVLATRPPLDDPEGRDDPARFGPRKIILRNGGELEQGVFDAVRRYIKFGTRKKIQLTPEAIETLRPEHRPRMSYLEFYENRGRGHFAAQIQQHLVGPGHAPVKPAAAHPSTIGYLIRTEQMPGAKCGLVVSFGMDGFSTLVWNRILRTRHPEWLHTPGFRMAELIFKRALPERALTPEFADDASLIDVRLLTSAPLPAPVEAALNHQPVNHRPKASGRAAASRVRKR